jgi:hypothetical protein
VYAVQVETSLGEMLHLFTKELVVLELIVVVSGRHLGNVYVDRGLNAGRSICRPSAVFRCSAGDNGQGGYAPAKRDGRFRLWSTGTWSGWEVMTHS